MTIGFISKRQCGINYLNKNNDSVMLGTVRQEVVDGGLLGLSKTIIIQQSGKEYEFRVAGADDSIKKVSILYLQLYSEAS